MSSQVSLIYPQSKWFDAVCLLFMGLAAVPLITLLPSSKPMSTSEILLLFSEFQFFTCFGIQTVLMLLLHRIETDDSGVSWRTFKGKHHAEWSEVTDYYEKLPSIRNAIQHSAANPIMFATRELWVETKHGKFLMASYLKGDFQAFREQVQQSAVNARSHEWELYGTRTCDSWPRVFHYAPHKRRVLAWSYGMGAAVYTAAAPTVLWRFCEQWYASLGSDEVHFLYRMVWLIAIWPIVILALNCFGQIRVLRHACESVVITPQGFEYQGTNGETIAADWCSVLDYYVQPTGLWRDRSMVSLKGGDEKSWSFTEAISAPFDLHYIIKKYAPSPQSAPLEGALWPLKSGERSITSSAANFYHYRNRNVRSMLIISTGFCALFPLIGLLQYFLKIPARPTDTPAFVMGLFLILVAGIAYGWWRSFVGGVETDDFWITQRTLFGRRRIAWISISDYQSVGDPYIVCGQNGRPIAFWSSISRFQELTAEIERRARRP